MVFTGSWFLNTPESVSVGFLLEFSFLFLQNSPKANIVSLVPCLCISFDILVIEESYEALLVNVTTKVLAPPYSTVFKSLQCDMDSLQHQ